MRKLIVSFVAMMSILCLTGCESPEQRQHNLDSQSVSNSEEEVVEKHSSSILYASIEGELFEITDYKTYAKNDLVTLVLKDGYKFMDGYVFWNEYKFKDGYQPRDGHIIITCNEIVTSMDKVIIFQGCEKCEEVG